MTAYLESPSVLLWLETKFTNLWSTYFTCVCATLACVISLYLHQFQQLSSMCLLMNVRASNFLRCWFARQESQKRTPPTHIVLLDFPCGSFCTNQETASNRSLRPFGFSPTRLVGNQRRSRTVSSRTRALKALQPEKWKQLPSWEKQWRFSFKPLLFPALATRTSTKLSGPCSQSSYLSSAGVLQPTGVQAKLHQNNNDTQATMRTWFAANFWQLKNNKHMSGFGKKSNVANARNLSVRPLLCIVSRKPSRRFASNLSFFKTNNTLLALALLRKANLNSQRLPVHQLC